MPSSFTNVLPNLSRAPQRHTQAFEFFREICRTRLPYGIWTCADGRQVLFNRQYQPIWQRSPGEKARSNVSDEWVPYEGQCAAIKLRLKPQGTYSYFEGELYI